jgi:hypothetical protein
MDSLGRGCRRTLSIDRFYRKPQKRNPEYRDLLCKDCRNAVTREWRIESGYDETLRQHERTRYTVKQSEILARKREYDRARRSPARASALR